MPHLSDRAPRNIIIGCGEGRDCMVCAKTTSKLCYNNFGLPGVREHGMLSK